jgi:formylglycine-generating enzyme required for sulfatase activity
MKQFILALVVLIASIAGCTMGGMAPSPQTKTIGGIEFVCIKGGSFMMGSPDSDSNALSWEKPPHKVTVSPFWMGKYEVTQKQYQDIMGTNPSHFVGTDHDPSKHFVGTDHDPSKYPVEQVSWHDAKSFCEKFSAKYGVTVRLPYEAEWEYACRAGTTTKYYWGDSMNDAYCWYGGNSGDKTHPVGQKLPNAYGLYDMSGNVCEWCKDWWESNYYASSPEKNPTGPSNGTFRVLRGGSYFITVFSVLFVRSANRAGIYPTSWSDSDGFRVVVAGP